MSIIVKGMKMPEKCGSCDLFHAESPMHCTVVKGNKTVGAPYGMHRPEWCPLVALPDRHGRLIDADACAEYFWEHLDDNGMAGAMNAINDMPTIVEAEAGT